MSEISTKPYLIRAIYEWCVDGGFTPYIAVLVDARTRVPMEHVKDGQIVLNIGYDATRNLKIDNDMINFSARFNGTSRELAVPVSAVMGIFAKENGQGMFFKKEEAVAPSETPEQDATPVPSAETPVAPPRSKPTLKVIK